MRSKASLTLIEQVVMLLMLSVAAALCLRAFVWADTSSVAGAEQDRALLQAQSAAEILKGCRGDWEQAAKIAGGNWNGSVWQLCWDENWQETTDDGTYILLVSPADGGLKYLSGAQVEVIKGEHVLASFMVNWQEVGGNE